MKSNSVKLIISIMVLVAVALFITGCKKDDKQPLKVAYSDWPGWVAWDIGIQKGFFEKVGVDVEFLWFEYVASMDAFAAGKVDAVTMTNGDALVTGSTGAANVMIMVNDYSNGNDMVVAKPGIETLADLKGKKIGVEIGFVDHLLLLKGLEESGMTENDVELVNVPTHQTAQTLASGDVDAIAAWQPNSGAALKALGGSKAVYSSANVPGLIYDTLAVSPQSLSERREDWVKVVKAWYMIVDFINDPANEKEVLEIMSARVNVSPEEYAGFMSGTKFLTLSESKSVFKKGDGFTSIYGSSKIVDEFNLNYKVYDSAQDITAYIDPSIMEEL